MVGGFGFLRFALPISVIQRDEQPDQGYKLVFVAQRSEPQEVVKSEVMCICKVPESEDEQFEVPRAWCRYRHRERRLRSCWSRTISRQTWPSRLGLLERASPAKQARAGASRA